MTLKLRSIGVLVALALLAPAAFAQFGNDSIRGLYAATATIGNNAGYVLGTCSFDGSGAFDCAFTANVPGEEGARQVFPFTSEGTVAVNADGTIVVSEVDTLADGSTNPVTHDGVITQAIRLGAFSLATEMRSAIREPGDPSGSLVTATLTRISDRSAMADAGAANIALVRRFYEAVNAKDLGAFDAFVAADFTDHNPFPGQPPGLEGLKWAIGGFLAAFPDLSVLNDAEFIASGDQVVVHHTFRGTHGGTFVDIEATGREIAAGAIDIWTVRGGMLVAGAHVEEIFQVVAQLTMP